MPPELEYTTQRERGSELSDVPAGRWCQRLGIWCQRTPAGNEVAMGMLLLFDPARRPVGLGVSVLGLWLIGLNWVAHPRKSQSLLCPARTG